MTEQYMTIQQATEFYKTIFPNPIHASTIRLWMQKHDIGVKIGGKWWVDKVKFAKFLKGKS